METILRWLAGLLADILERYSDPDLDARLAAYKAKIAEAEAKEKEAEELARQSEAAYKESLRNRLAWDALLIESRANEKVLEEELRASQERATKIRDDADKAKQVIDSRPDADVLRDPF